MTTRWVLLRGLSREAAHWGSFVAALQERSGDVVLAVDLPGTGSRRDEAGPWHVSAMAERCRQALPAHDGPTVLVALSLGAMVAIEWCRQDPAQVAGCVLVNTSAGGRSAFWQRLRPIHYRTIARMLAGMAVPERERRILAMTSARPALHVAVLPLWVEIAQRRAVRPLAVLRQFWAAARFRPGPTPPPVPMLVLASDGDRLVAPDCSRRLARDWSLPLREHPWAGHDLPLDDPQWVIDAILEWWATARSAAAQ